MDNLSLMIALAIAAMAFFLLEVLTPMFGIMAGMGIAACAGTILSAFFVSRLAGIVTLVITIVWVPAYLVLIVRVLPQTWLGKHLFLGRAHKADRDAMPQSHTYRELIGKQGVTVTPLHPTGAVRIGGQRVIASAEQGMIADDTPVTVIRATGMNVVVRPAEPSES